METESFISNNDFNISEGLFVFAVTAKALLGYYFMFSIKIVLV